MTTLLSNGAMLRRADYLIKRTPTDLKPNPIWLLERRVFFRPIESLRVEIKPYSTLKNGLECEITWRVGEHWLEDYRIKINMTFESSPVRKLWLMRNDRKPNSGERLLGNDSFTPEERRRAERLANIAVTRFTNL